MRRVGLACTALVVWGSVAHAQMAVIDVPLEISSAKSLAESVIAAGKRVEAINNQIAELARLKQTYEAVSHGDMAALANLAPELGALGLTSPLGDDMASLANSLAGLGGNLSATASLSQDLLRTDQLYTPSGGDFRAIAINQAAAALASQKALADCPCKAAGRGWPA